MKPSSCFGDPNDNQCATCKLIRPGYPEGEVRWTTNPVIRLDDLPAAIRLLESTPSSVRERVLLSYAKWKIEVGCGQTPDALATFLHKEIAHAEWVLRLYDRMMATNLRDTRLRAMTRQLGL
jgi:hypothetical protein